MRLEKVVVALWAILILTVSIRSFFFPRTHSVYPIFAQAARDWIEGDDAYFPAKDRGLDQYRYAPVVTVGLIPLSVLPNEVGGVLWRLLNVGAFLGGFAWFCHRIPLSSVFGVPRREGDVTLSTPRRSLLFLLLLPLSIGSLNNGQANLLVLGLLLIGVTACTCQRWSLAAVVVAVACFLKLYPLAIGLLLVLVFFKQFSWRFTITLVVGAALPFVLAPPDYVTHAYSSWFDRLRADDRTFSPVTAGYRDLWFLLRTAGVPITREAYLGVQLASAGLIAAICAAGRRRGWPDQELAASAFMLGCCWMVLLGPATESSTYCLLSPVLALAFVDAFRPAQPAWTRWLMCVILALLLVSQASRWFPQGRDWTSPLLPLGGLLLFAERLLRSVRNLVATNAVEARPLARAA